MLRILVPLFLCLHLLFSLCVGLALTRETRVQDQRAILSGTAATRASVLGLEELSPLVPLTDTDACPSDPVACANSLIQPFGGFAEVLILVILWGVILSVIVFVSISAWRGIIGLGTGEPRVLATVIVKVIGLFFLAFIAIKAPDLVKQVMGSAGQHLQPIQLPTIGG